MICVGQIGAPHGVHGAVRLFSFTQDPTAVTSYGRVQTDDGQELEITALRPGKGYFIARLSGVNDRDEAARLTNQRLYVPRERLPPTEDTDTFYHADLIGLAAETADGAPLGKVTAIYNHGAGDLIEITRDGKVTLVPFTHRTVPNVDLAGGRIIVEPLIESD
jgi:16S rRNA processing protein RimM